MAMYNKEIVRGDLAYLSVCQDFLDVNRGLENSKYIAPTKLKSRFPSNVNTQR